MIHGLCDTHLQKSTFFTEKGASREEKQLGLLSQEMTNSLGTKESALGWLLFLYINSSAIAWSLSAAEMGKSPPIGADWVILYSLKPAAHSVHSVNLQQLEWSPKTQSEP